ncbi:MAG: hypothetical protein H0W39_04815 [Sphingomonas sp.]|nr:hypothetical protein [Sphingomonas sp.]
MADDNKMNQQNSNNETMKNEQSKMGGDRQHEKGQFDKDSKEKGAIGGGEQSSTSEKSSSGQSQGQNPMGQSQNAMGQGQNTTGQADKNKSESDKNKSDSTSR